MKMTTGYDSTWTKPTNGPKPLVSDPARMNEDYSIDNVCLTVVLLSCPLIYFCSFFQIAPRHVASLGNLSQTNMPCL
jgi:hypothetical protein